MMLPRAREYRPGWFAAGTFSLILLPAVCAAGIDELIEHISITGDFRTRIESDFDSQNASGDDREDRTRLRIRARLGMTYGTGPLRFGLRVRSGSDDSQQSPHITIADFDGNDTGDADFNLDQ